MSSSLSAGGQRARCVVLGSQPSSFSLSCWGSCPDRSSPGGLECLLDSPKDWGHPHPQALRDLFRLSCAPLPIAYPSAPLASGAVDFIEQLLCGRHWAACFHRGCLVSSSKQPFEGSLFCIPDGEKKKQQQPEAYSGCHTVKWKLDFKPKLFASSSLFSVRCKTFQKETRNESPA